MNKIQMMIAITDRARAMEILYVDGVTFRFDLMNVERQCGLRLEDFLNADDENFIHDVVGIQRHINRETCRLENFFSPRFSDHNRG